MMSELVRVNLRKQIADIDIKMKRLSHRKMEILQRLGESEEEAPSSSTEREVNDVQRNDSACDSTHDGIRGFDGSCDKTQMFRPPVSEAEDNTDKGDDYAAMLANCVNRFHEVGRLDVPSLYNYVAKNGLDAQFFKDVFLRVDHSLPVTRTGNLKEEWQDYVHHLLKQRI